MNHIRFISLPPNLRRVPATPPTSFVIGGRGLAPFFKQSRTRQTDGIAIGRRPQNDLSFIAVLVNVANESVLIAVVAARTPKVVSNTADVSLPWALSKPETGGVVTALVIQRSRGQDPEGRLLEAAHPLHPRIMAGVRPAPVVDGVDDPQPRVQRIIEVHVVQIDIKGKVCVDVPRARYGELIPCDYNGLSTIDLKPTIELSYSRIRRIGYEGYAIRRGTARSNFETFDA